MASVEAYISPDSLHTFYVGEPAHLEDQAEAVRYIDVVPPVATSLCQAASELLDRPPESEYLGDVLTDYTEDGVPKPATRFMFTQPDDYRRWPGDEVSDASRQLQLEHISFTDDQLRANVAPFLAILVALTHKNATEGAKQLTAIVEEQ